MGVCLKSSGDAWYCESQVYSIFSLAVLRVLAWKKETNETTNPKLVVINPHPWATLLPFVRLNSGLPEWEAFLLVLLKEIILLETKEKKDSKILHRHGRVLRLNNKKMVSVSAVITSAHCTGENTGTFFYYVRKM